MGIKDETPDDKVIFDSIDNRMRYSKKIEKSRNSLDEKCNTCYYKETNPAKYPCEACLNTDNNDLWAPTPKEAGLEPKMDNPEPKPYEPKNMDDIYNVLNLILEELRNGKKED